MKEDLFDISFRANYTVKEYLKKKVLIYDDHRCLLNILFFLQEN
jgi:hypothetical protein